MITPRRWHRWDTVAAVAAEVPDQSVDAAHRALDYLCAAQLYLRDNVLLERPLEPTDVKDLPTGHWGVCPPVNLVLAALGPLIANSPEGCEVLVVHGAGHAGPSALAHAYLTGTLGRAHPAFRRSPAGLRHLVTGFPHPETLGGEITPLIPGHLYTGGQLGPALAFAQGAALDAPHRLVIPLIGDGECETGATAAGWLGARALRDTGQHGQVLPVVMLNGQRMGGPSLLAGLSHGEIHGYFTGLGYRPIITDGHDIRAFRTSLTRSLTTLVPLGDRPAPVLVLTLRKGHGAPDTVAGQRIAGTPRVHKTPLRDPRRDPAERSALQDWLASYRADQLITPSGMPAACVRRTLCAAEIRTPRPPTQPARRTIMVRSVPDFGTAVGAIARHRGAAGELRVFSPDELDSNRVDLNDPEGRPPAWVTEILNEELCHAWAQGYLETGRSALVITYEAFATIATSLLVQHLKYRAVARHAGRPPTPNITYLLTSLGWNNTHSHQNPGLVSALLATGDPTVRVLTPADPTRCAAALDEALAGHGQCVIVVASKHVTATHPTGTINEELARGLARWPHLSDPIATPDLVLASAGDLPARQLSRAVEQIRARAPHARLRYLHIHDLTILADPGSRPRGLPQAEFDHYFGDDCPVLLATTTQRDAIHSLLWTRPRAQRFRVLGYQDPARPIAPDQLLRHCGLDVDRVTERAVELLADADRRPTRKNAR